MRSSSDPRRYRGSLAWMARAPVVANILTFGILLGGLVTALVIKQEVFPEFELDTVTISVPYPGASPEEVERGIVMAVEEAVRGLDGVRRVHATAREGLGTVTVECITGYDRSRLAQDIKSAVDRIVTFPEEAEEPQVAESSRRRRTMTYALYGDLDERVLRDTAEMIRDHLLLTRIITQVDFEGARPAEISVEIPQERLRAHGLTLARVAQKIREASVELPGGGLKTDAGEFLVRMRDRRDWGREFANLPIIAEPGGAVVRLGELADVRDGFEDLDRRIVYNGQPALLINIYRVGDQKPLALADVVRRQMDVLRARLPSGVNLMLVDDFSETYRQRLDLLFRNGVSGLALVLIILALFLEWRLAGWVAVSIPVSFLGAVLLMPAADVSINMMSIFGFIIALGMVVDNGIVIGESIYVCRSEGRPPLLASILGVRLVAIPVVFSVLTNIATFLPLLFVSGITGKIYSSIPVVVIFVFLISMAECLWALPAHVAHMNERRGGRLGAWLHNRQQVFSQAFMRWVWGRYAPMLDRLIARRWAVLASGIALLAISVAYVGTGRLRLVFSLPPDSDFSQVTLTLPYGSPISRTEELATRITTAARQVERESGGTWVLGTMVDIGGAQQGAYAGGHSARIRVYLPQPDRRPISTSDFTRRWREATGPLSGVESAIFRADTGGPGSGAAITVELSHTEMSALRHAGEDLAVELSRFSLVKDVDDGFQLGKPQFDFTVRDEARRLGLTSREIASQVRAAFYGVEALRQQRGRDELKVMVRLPEAERRKLHTLEELWVRAPDGGEMPLREAADLHPGRAYTEISRRDGRRVISVEADVSPRNQSPPILAALKSGILDRLVERRPGLTYGFEGRQADLAEAMQSLKMGLIGSLLLVYILLAIPFRSYLQPLIVMVSIPFGIVGAVWGHVALGYTLTIISLFGILALAGVVVNSSLVLIEFTNRLQAEGRSPRQAIHEAAVHRFRPIVLTAATTFGGLAPMIFETSRQARFLIPMAISLGFGVLFATLISLILVPALYVIVEDVRGWLRRGNVTPETTAPPPPEPTARHTPGPA
ncbi:MAG: efflux RND transporter permease subunit [Kiritimatiellae bacterium]|nr:efflux RND transporter permease subunit [Kiritimatiellia bacterium]